MRLLNRPLALLLALAFAATGVIVAIEVIAHAVDAKPVVVPWVSWQHWAMGTRWNRAVVKVWAVILMIVGLTLLVSQLKPRRVGRLAMRASDSHTDIAMTRRGLAGAVRAAVLDVDGIASVDAVVSRRRVRAVAVSNAQSVEAAAELTEPARAAAQDAVESLDLTRSLRVRVTVRGAKS